MTPKKILEEYPDPKAVWLNLGCSDRNLKFFKNVDIRPESGADIIDDVRTLSSVEDNSVDLIYACHLFEHFDKHEYPVVLRNWYKKLKEGGELRLAVPDIEAACTYIAQTGIIEYFYSSFWGSQRNEFDYHKWGWTEITLRNALKYAGFKNVKRWNWQDTYPHFLDEYDDYARAYIPHKDFEHGRLISLNMHGFK